MTDQLKKEIITAANDYMTTNGMSQNAMCAASKINVGYLSYMLKGDLSINNTVIADKWFNQLADYIGFKVAKTYWPTQSTPQFLSIIATLQEAKTYPKSFMVIAPTGAGKTYAVDRFVNQHPINSYRITVGSHYRLPDILNEICEAVGVPTNGLTYDRLNRLSAKLKEIKMSGGQPEIIIDEAENLKTAVLQLLKSLYDKVSNYCSIVLIGTEELINKIERGCNKGISGMPQFKRRFKAGTRVLPVIDQSFESILESFQMNKEFKRLIRSLCANYGELRDYLEPVIREADLKGCKLSEELFRAYHNLPKYQ